ncbi:RNI-like superfamily protein [Wolffia australiana]
MNERGKGARVCINEVLTDDELRVIFSKLDTEEARDGFSLVCKRWLLIQSSERRRIRARAGSAMLQRMADRFSGIVAMDLSQSASRSFFPGLSDSDLAVVAVRFWRLVSLNLGNCKGISDAGMEALGRDLSSLQSLDVTGCRKLTDNGLKAVAGGCPKLKTLNVSGCKLLTDELLHSLAKHCRGLKHLGLAGCHNITARGLISLGHGCKRLSFLDVSKCDKVNDDGVSAIAKSSSSSLKTLKLLDCANLGDSSVLAMAEHCENLDTVVLGGCRRISEAALKALVAACCSSIRILKMDWCPGVGDSLVSSVLAKCRRLERLDVSCCDRVTDVGFGGLGFRSELRVFRASGCPRITVSGLGQLLGFSPCMELIDVSACPHVTKEDCMHAGLEFPSGCKVNFSSSPSEPIVDLYF